MRMRAGGRYQSSGKGSVNVRFCNFFDKLREIENCFFLGGRGFLRGVRFVNGNKGFSEFLGLYHR